MRTLSTQESAKIDQRLESLRIHYLEIYHELRDHYFSELEKKPTEEFEVVFQELNETFAWSVVKNMEKELRNVTNHYVTKMQLEALKPWKLNVKDALLVSCCVLGYLISFRFWSVEGIVLFVASIALVGLIFILKYQLPILSWSLKVSKQKPVHSFNSTITARLGLFYSVLSLFYVGISNWGTSKPGEFGTLLLLSSSLFVLFYILTLAKVATNIKKVEIKSSTK